MTPPQRYVTAYGGPRDGERVPADMSVARVQELLKSPAWHGYRAIWGLNGQLVCLRLARIVK